ncbi:MAG: thioredoxin family protein [Thermoproteales archaeon]|nr:thioredoxin family protein [Thermoproteales archaeon]
MESEKVTNELQEVGSKLPEILASYKTVVVDFWAEWCIPCKAVEDILVRIKKRFSNVYICKLNVDENPDIAAKYSVLNLPTVIIFHEKKEAYRFTGAPTGLYRKIIQILSNY